MVTDNEEEFAVVEDETHTKRELELAKDNERLRLELDKAKRTAKIPKALVDAKKILRPIYDALKMIFEEVAESGSADSASNPAWQTWLQKAGGGARGKMLAVVIERGQLTRPQLTTLAGVSIRSSTFRNGLSWMRSNKLVTVEGDIVRRAQL